MKISRMSSTLGIVRSRSRSQHDFEIFLLLPPYKLSGPITQLWYKLVDIKRVCLSDNNIQMLKISSRLKDFTNS